MDPSSTEQIDQDKYNEAAIRAITDRRQLPEIDFSIHRMEDGTEVSTLERVCKGMFLHYFLPSLSPLKLKVVLCVFLLLSLMSFETSRCSGACIQLTHR